TRNRPADPVTVPLLVVPSPQAIVALNSPLLSSVSGSVNAATSALLRLRLPGGVTVSATDSASGGRTTPTVPEPASVLPPSSLIVTVTVYTPPDWNTLSVV